MKVLSLVTRHSAATPSTMNSTSASVGETRRAASGRSRVRLTCGSMSRSAKSLMTQPAARMRTTPNTKTINTSCCGLPPLATHNAQSAGQSSSHVPMGRSSARACRTPPNAARCGGRRAPLWAWPPGRGRLRLCCCSSAFARIPGSDSCVLPRRTDPAGGERGNTIRVLRDQQLRRVLYARQQVRIARQIRHTQLGQAGLPGAEKLAGTSQLEIAARDLEAVIGIADDLQALARQRRERCAVEQHAGARFRRRDPPCPAAGAAAPTPCARHSR